MTQRTPEPGLVLAGRYKLETKLGEGGMGTVWRAEHLVLCAPVAVKVLDRDVSKDEEAHDRFIREARSAATLRSPHVVQTLDYGIDQGMPFIAMELLEGETLQHRLARMGKLSPGDTARIINHVARAVGRAHEAGIIHRDLKPENVFLVKNEDAEIAKVLDFGVAKVDTQNLGPKGARTRTGSLLGTPFYMSPEQAQGNKTIDHRSDLWALAVIAFECITGKRPFESDGLGELVLQICVHPVPKPSQFTPVSQKLEDWFSRAMARDPDKRFQSSRELAESLREAIGGEAQRETMSTLSDFDDLPPAPSSPIIIDVAEDDEPPDSAAIAKTVATAASVPKPSLTIQQFGTTQATSPPPRGRVGLLLGVGIFFLAAGVVGGFVILNSTGGMASLGFGGSGPAPTNTTTPPVEPADAASTAPEAAASSEPETSEKPVASAADAAVAADADAKVAEAADGAAVPKTGDPKHPEKVEKVDKKKDAGGFTPKGDWGKVEEGEDPILRKTPPPPPPEEPPSQ
jgi:serine/threonine-protein kinase